MRTLVVEATEETVEAPLLCEERWRRRARGLALQRQVHALVATVLLRLARLDALVTDAELEPPGGQARQTSRAGGGERWAVVAAKCARQPEFAKDPRQDATHGRAVGGCDSDTADDEATEGVGDGQRNAPLPVAGAKLALEVDAPHLIRRGARRKRQRAWRGAAPTASRCDETGAPENLADGARRRRIDTAAAQPRAQLTRPPVRMLASSLHDDTLKLHRRRSGVRVRSA